MSEENDGTTQGTRCRGDDSLVLEHRTHSAHVYARCTEARPKAGCSLLSDDVHFLRPVRLGALASRSSPVEESTRRRRSGTDENGEALRVRDEELSFYRAADAVAFITLEDKERVAVELSGDGDACRDSRHGGDDREQTRAEHRERGCVLPPLSIYPW